jgi:hypothetical protein
MTVLITLTTAGADSGPFDLYTNLDGYVSAFATGVSKSALLAGYTSSAVPDFATIIRVKSTGDCVNYIDITLVGITTTTTTTATPTTTTTTTAAPTVATIDIANFSLDVSVDVVSILVNAVTVTQTGGTSPLLPGNSATATTTELGTNTIYITGGSTIVGQHITVTGSDSIAQCLPAGGGATNWTFPGVVIDGITNVIIDIADGVC